MAEVRKVNNMREKDNENEVQEEFALTSDAELQNGTEAAVGGGNTPVTPFAELASGSEGEISSGLRREDEPIFNVMPPVKTFTGRTGELNKLHEKLQKPRKPTLVSQCVAISGLGGVGKSELARKYAWENQKLYTHTIWINCGTKFDTLKSFKKLAEDLKILKPTQHDDENESDPKGLEKDVQSILPKIYKRLAKSILIFDNVDQFEDIKDFFPTNLSSADEKPAIIITSRNSDWDIGEEGVVDVILLNEFTYEEAESYVRKSLQINDADKSCDFLISRLIETLCYFPLALHQAVSYIKTKNSLRGAIQEHLNEFRDEEKKGNLLKWSPKHDRYTSPTHDTWRVTFENIKEERNGDLAILLVEIMSYLAPHQISPKMFIEIVEDEERLKKTMDILVKYSIVTVQGNVVSIHKLIQLVVRLWLKDNQREEDVLGMALTVVYKYLHAYFLSHHLFPLWSYAYKYTTLIDDHICKTCDESEHHPEFIAVLCDLVEDGNVCSIRKILDHLESKGDLWYKLCWEMFLEVRVKCNHKDPSTEDTCHETHVKNICLLHTELNQALKTSKTEELKEFLQSFDKSLINSWFNRRSALHEAVERGNLDVTKILIENGADINIRNNDDEYPLTVALRKEHPKVAEYLLDQGANPNPDPDDPHRKPIHYAAIFGYVNIMQRLAVTKEARESKFVDDWTPLHFAAEKDHLEIVEFLTSKVVDVTAMTDYGQTACHIAVKNGSIRVVKYLIDNKLVNVNLLNGRKESLLHTAATHGQLDIVKYLLSDETHVKADINAFDIYGMTPLLQAVAYGNIEIMRYLIHHGASVDNVQNETTLLGKLKLSALHLAAARNYIEIAKILVEELKADINMGLDTSVSPLQVAKLMNSTEVGDFLLEKGAVESAKDNSKNAECIWHSFFADNEIKSWGYHLPDFSELFTPCCKISGIINFFLYNLTFSIQHECTYIV